MKKRTWVLLDVNNLAYRAMYTTGRLSHGGDPTGVAFGIFRDVKALQDRFAPHGFVFCFDYGPSLREKDFPYYKEPRRKKKYTEKEQKARAAMKSQVENLRTKWLAEMGYNNVFYQNGYEADDIIASVVKNLDDHEEAIIVSNDEDMYQLLAGRVMVFQARGQKLITFSSFKQKYGVHPSKWVQAKAIGGCSTDNVTGVYGVAEKTACAYLRGGFLGDKGKQKDIEEFLKTPQYQDNLRLVRLPYPGTMNFVPVEDSTEPRRVREVLDRLGIKSLQTKAGIRGFGLRF